jgi:hypothetical protein
VPTPPRIALSPRAYRYLLPLLDPSRVGANPEPDPDVSNFLAACQEEYERTRKPAYVWDALACVLAGNRPVPDWTRPYVRDVAIGISRLSRARRSPRKRTIAPTIARIVFPRRGRTNPFDAIPADVHELLIAFHVYECHTRNRHAHREGREGTADWTIIFQEAAREHLRQCDRCRRAPSTKTIERYWRKHALSVIPPHLVARARSRKIDDILR